jgi:hypothetical protein
MKIQPIILREPKHFTRVVEVLDSLPQDTLYEVLIRKHKSSRSLAQNRLMWKWYDIIRIHIADSGGQLFTAEDLHEWYKAKFLPSKVVAVDGEPIRCRASTASLRMSRNDDTPEGEVTMHEYLDMIDRHSADSLNLVLPTPSDLGISER